MPQIFAAGICFPTGEQCQPAQLTILKADTDQSQASLTISEGKFHQVKKNVLTYGLKVTSETDALCRTGTRSFSQRRISLSNSVRKATH